VLSLLLCAYKLVSMYCYGMKTGEHVLLLQKNWRACIATANILVSMHGYGMKSGEHVLLLQTYW